MQGLSLYAMSLTGLAGILLGLGGVLFCRRTERRLGPALRTLFGLTLGASTLLAVWEGVMPLYWLPAAVFAVLITLGSIGVAAWLVAKLATLHGLLRSPRLAWTVLLIGTPAVCLWWILHLEQNNVTDLVELSQELALLEPHQLEEVASPRVVTDADRPVPLFRLAGGVAASDIEQAEKNYLSRNNYHLRLIRTASVNLQSNCHGWVFTGGTYWVKGGAVDSILDDNGYRPVQDPQPNDVVLYRDVGGRVQHTGLVRFSAKGEVMIESKWGQVGCFLHRPEDQSYSTTWTYYRSPRTSHLLRGLDSSSPLPGLAFQGSPNAAR